MVVVISPSGGRQREQVSSSVLENSTQPKECRELEAVVPRFLFNGGFP